MASVRDPQVEHARQAIRAALFGPPDETSTDAATIGRFELVDKLGEGGMGVVYSARDPSLDRRVAIKLLRPAQAEAHGGKERLQREAHALAKLSHPNVVVVHEVGLHEGQVYLVMEFVDGVNLLQWCRDHTADWRTVVAKYTEAGRGLAVAHQAGFVHRDFKPDNVLVGRDGRVRVLDFGLAASGAVDDSLFESVESQDDAAEDLTLTGTVLGTPAYMAPEQHHAESVDARADQFAFCVALWETLFGERPFPGSDLPSLRASLVDDARRPAPASTDVPAALVRALERGLSIDPEARFSDMPSLLAQLQAASELPSESPRRGPVWAAAGAVVATGLGIVIWSSAEPTVTSRDDDVVHVSAPPVEATPQAQAAPRPVSFRQLTHTGGRGLNSVDIDHASDRLLYEEEALLMRSIEGGVPKVVELPFDDYDHVSLRDGGGYLVAHDGRLTEVTASGEMNDLAEYDRGIQYWSLSNDGRWLRALSSFTMVTWDLADSSPPTRVVLPMAKLQSLAGAPDSRAVAATSYGRDEPAQLLIFDHEGRITASTDLSGPFSSVQWLSNGALVVLEDDRSEFWLRCFHLEGNSLVAGARSTALGPYSRFNRIVEADGPNKLLLTLTDARNDVVLIDPAEAAKTRWLSDGWDGDDSDPVWRADGTLAVATGRFLQRTLVSVGEDYESVTPISEDPVEWVESDGAGGLVYATDEDPTALRWIVAGATAPATLAIPGLPEHAESIKLDCIRPDDCLLTAEADGVATFFALDLTRAQMQRRFECPWGWSCDWGRRRWSYARDGKRVLMLHGSQRRFAEFDAMTGDLVRTHADPPASTIVQSVRETADGSGYWMTGMDGRKDTDSDGLYVLYRYEPETGYRVVWHDASRWVFGVEPSPDDALLAAEALTLHSEAWLADIGDLCGSEVEASPARDLPTIDP